MQCRHILTIYLLSCLHKQSLITIFSLYQPRTIVLPQTFMFSEQAL